MEVGKEKEKKTEEKDEEKGWGALVL